MFANIKIFKLFNLAKSRIVLISWAAVSLPQTTVTPELLYGVTLLTVDLWWFYCCRLFVVDETEASFHRRWSATHTDVMTIWHCNCLALLQHVTVFAIICRDGWIFIVHFILDFNFLSYSGFFYMVFYWSTMKSFWLEIEEKRRRIESVDMSIVTAAVSVCPVRPVELYSRHYQFPDHMA